MSSCIQATKERAKGRANGGKTCNTKVVHTKMFSIDDMYGTLHFSKIKDMTFQPTDIHHPTEVAEVTSWSPPGRQSTIFMLYDVGGHDSYKNTAHVFQVGTRCTVFSL